MKKETSWIDDAWFKVDFIINEYYIDFEAFRISGKTENIEDSDTEEQPSIKGSIKWDGCMNFKQHDHYCGVEFAEQVFILFRFIYDFGEENMEVLT